MVEFATCVNNKSEILSLPVAITSDGFCLFYTRSFVESYGNTDTHRGGMAVAYDNRGKGWIIGKGMARYQVFNTFGVILQKRLDKAFPAGEQHTLEVDRNNDLMARNSANHCFKVKIVDI